MNNPYEHKPVLTNEVSSLLITDTNGLYVDCTAGLGGHISSLMCKLGPKARIVAVDRDSEALQLAEDRLAEFKGRVQFVHSEYSKIKAVLTSLGIDKVNGVLLDLGYSSYQIDNPERGFSFSKNGPLDMRYDRKKGITAEKFIEKASLGELTEAIRTYGEERNARRIAGEIVKCRSQRQIKTTFELAEIVRRAVNQPVSAGRIDSATKTFQAIRIAVNNELEHLEVVMQEIAESLISKGRMAVISFHSLEDRVVKDYIFNSSRGCTCAPFLPKCVCGHKKILNLVVPKIIRPSIEEVEQNPRARSARLRVAERI